MKCKLSCFVLLTIIYISSFLGCTSRLVTLEDSPGCNSTFEGIFFADPIIVDNVPNIIFKGDVAIKELRGNILDIDSSVIKFQKSSGAIFNSEEIFVFPLDTIQCAIDSSGKLIYGTVPKIFLKPYTLFLNFELQQNPDLNGLYIEIDPNEPFAYCFPPGDYKITEIEFRLNKKERQIAINLPELSFIIEPNKSNYFGEIHFNKNIVGDYSLNIPTKLFDENSASQAAFFGGLIGSAIYEMSHSAGSADNYQKIDFKFDKFFLSEANLPIRICKLKIKQINYSD